MSAVVVVVVAGGLSCETADTTWLQAELEKLAETGFAISKCDIMGVLGIAPFLQKTCPHVFKKLPDRLTSLRGRTVVIDGTLVTQRLHFAPMPHPHRHIIGWHRILTELRDSDVRVICVFDGQQRSAAKVREAERRRESRQMDAARGFIETTRLHRLRKLMRLLSYYRSLPTTDRQRVDDALSSIKSAHRSLDAHVSGFPLLAHTCPPLHPPSSSQHSCFFSHTSMGIHDFQDVSDLVAVSPSTSRSGLRYVPPLPDLEKFSHAITDDEIGPCILFDGPYDDIFPTLPFVHWNAAVQPAPKSSCLPADPIESFQSELFTLYSEYSQSVSQLTSMPSSFDRPEIPIREHVHPTPAGSPDILDAKIEYAMSKQQLQMTLDEGQIWNYLSGRSSDVRPLDFESALMTLAERSSVISRSYQRRSKSPTAEIYEACKELLHAMGVPCIESSGPFEAEALACALVIHGHADYVVSEDTDVLVYEAPMLRGITTRESPIIVVHGEAIRANLQLDRASYVDFALLLGTDFSQRIKNVGPNRALKFIREHGSIERVVEQESKYPPRVPVTDYLAQVGIARLVFETLPPLPDIGLLQPTEGDPNILSEMIQRYGLHRTLPGAWNTQSALAGNYFEDDPSV